MAVSPYDKERLHARYSLDVRAKLSLEGREITVRTLDVSEGGLGLVSPVEIAEGSSYSVEFVFPTMQAVFCARVQAQSKSGFRYGFTFVEVNENNMTLLRKYQRRWGIAAKEYMATES
jgi:PilZ domain